jgi:hypothetical protein
MKTLTLSSRLFKQAIAFFALFAIIGVMNADAFMLIRCSGNGFKYVSFDGGMTWAQCGPCCGSAAGSAIYILPGEGTTVASADGQTVLNSLEGLPISQVKKPTTPTEKDLTMRSPAGADKIVLYAKSMSPKLKAFFHKIDPQWETHMDTK